MHWILVVIVFSNGGASGRTLAEPMTQEFRSERSCNAALRALANAGAGERGIRVTGECVER